MKRKTFIQNLAVGTVGATLLPNITFAESNKGNNKSSDWLAVEHSSDDYTATINCKAIGKNTKIIHIADSHLTVFKDGKTEFPEFAARMNKAFENPKHYLTGETGTRTGHFEEILNKAKNKEADLVLLTGDILNNPSIYGVEYLFEKLEESGLEYLFISGNHDWHFEGMKGSRESLRNKWIQKRLLPLYRGNNPLFYSKVVNGINFVMIDNSTYQINKEQLEFFREETKKNYPIVLAIHIPIYQPEDSEKGVGTIGDPRWGYDYDEKSSQLERRERWSKEGNKKETLEFIIEVLECKKLIAVLTGHRHSAECRKISPSANMYRTKGSFSAAHRFIEIIK